jgi:hypothetical protein
MSCQVIYQLVGSRLSFSVGFVLSVAMSLMGIRTVGSTDFA